jgi:hypothetical protein
VGSVLEEREETLSHRAGFHESRPVRGAVRRNGPCASPSDGWSRRGGSP